MSSTYEATGRVIFVGNLQQVGNNGFEKRELVLEVADGKYSQLIQFEFHNDHCSKLNRVAVGDQVEVGFNLRGRKWTDPKGVEKYFNTLAAWKLKRLGEAAPEPPAMPDEDIPF